MLEKAFNLIDKDVSMVVADWLTLLLAYASATIFDYILDLLLMKGIFLPNTCHSIFHL